MKARMIKRKVIIYGGGYDRAKEWAVLGGGQIVEVHTKWVKPSDIMADSINLTDPKDKASKVLRREFTVS